MHIILTHEQADFDAIASLLGANLIYNEAIPVLPRRINRNGRTFLTLYGIALPFIDPRDLHNDPIDTLTLVDTQSYVSIKGIGAETKIQVIDHHPLRKDIPNDWTITLADVGATATILVEVIRERGIMLNTVQATLLLLGIYEDTGSLTYTRTTARDLNAAAFLLEQGADLQIATNFLNQPLSTSQQKLYDKLLQNSEHIHTHGFTIVIVSGDSKDMDEELSSIAHKLRDFLDPDALFMLVTTRGGVQIIARSTCDNIDVAEILKHFGGGGHERAAAGLVKKGNIEMIKKELINILPKFVQPSITVAQIMSHRPQILTPKTPVKEAAERMRRYGYEGYPVVKDGKVVGLLTRRAVDRAIAHNLNLTAGSLMEAGSYSVHPKDSVEILKRVIAESGWGQIPVLDANDEIIGIVTRTDLLKTLPQQPRLPGKQNLSNRLEKALPPERLKLLKTIAQTAFDRNIPIFIVGGFVRDLILKRPSLDFDLVVEGDAIELAHSLARQYGGRVTSHSRFGTAKWILPKTNDPDHNQFSIPDLPFIDLVSARIEFYAHPSALPTVERGSIKLDLHRRDFTINTLALRLDGPHYGELYDYWGGLEDLKLGLVRVLHSLSFVDDPTRMLRAVRFEQRFQFKIEQRTLELLFEALSLLDRVSGARIRHELDHILIEPRAPVMMSRLKELNLMTSIHPALKWDEWLHSLFHTLTTDLPDPNWELTSYESGTLFKRDLSYTLWMIRLSPGEVESICKRLKLSTSLTKTIKSANELWRELPHLVKASPSKIVNKLVSTPPLSRYAVYIATSDEQLQNILINYATQWRFIKPKTDGHDLQALGLPPSPRYRYILESLRNAWLDGKISTEKEEQTMLNTLLQSHDNDVNI